MAGVGTGLRESGPGSGGAADGVDAAVDVQDLPRGHGEEVAEEGEAGLGHRRGVVDVPAEGRPVGPGVLEGAEPRYGLGRHGADRARRHQVHPDAGRPQLLGQVAGEGLEPRLGHAHPVVDGPGHRGVEVEADHRGAAVAARRLEEGEEGVDQRLERVGRDLEGRRDVVPVGGEHAAAQAVGRGEADGVQQAVEAVPPAGQRGAGGLQLLGRRDVDLEDLGLDGQLAGRAPGQRQGTAGAGEHDLGALLLGQAGHREGQRGVGEDAGDQEPLAVEESHCARRLCEGRGVHVGILGGTGPAGRGVAVRLAEAGIRVTLGSRDAERAAAVAADVVARWPDSDLELGGADNAGAAARRPGRPGHALGQRHRDRAVAAGAAGRQGRGLHGQCAGEGGPRDAGPDPAPGLDGRRRAGRRAREPGGGRLPPSARLGNGKPRIGVGS